MDAKTLLTASGAWLLIALAAIANGTLRQAVLTPALGDGPAQALSMAILLAVIVAISVALVRRRWRDLPRPTLIAIGIGWALGSILFEFALGRLVLGMPWSELLAQYDVLAGELWVLAPLTMMATPVVAREAMARRRQGVAARSS